MRTLVSSSMILGGVAWGSLAWAAGDTPPLQLLRTDYARRAAVEQEQRISLRIGLAESETIIDGESRGARTGGPSTEWSARLACRDAWLEDQDGALTRVRRTFDRIEGAFLHDYGGIAVQGADGAESEETELRSPFSEAILLLQLDDGEIVAEVEEGDADERAAESLPLELALDGLLPEAEVQEGQSWSIERDPFLAALGLPEHAALFPFEDQEEPRGAGADDWHAPFGLFGRLEWSVELTLEHADREGLAVIRIEAQGEGPPPASIFPEGYRESDAMRIDGSHQIDLEGELSFSLEDRIPTALELTGSIHHTTERAGALGERHVQFLHRHEGEFSLEVRSSLVTDQGGSAR